MEAVTSKKIKYKGNPVYHLLLFSLFSCFFGHQMFGQERINISTGIGLPELLHVGVRYQLEQAQIGLSVGALPAKDQKITSVSIDVYRHFGGLPKLSNRRPWYIRMGLNYHRDESDFWITKYLYFNPRFGRDINISKKIGIQLDAGAVFQLFHEEIRKVPPSGWDLDLDFPVLPSLGIALFYRL